MVVIGGGPAGLAAAVYASSDGLRYHSACRRRQRAARRHELDDPQLSRLPRGITGAELRSAPIEQARLFGTGSFGLRGSAYVV